MYKLCIGLLTYCDDKKMPERFEILKTSLESLREFVKDREEIFIYVWDNGSSENVKEYLKQFKFFNRIYFSKKNLYDVIAVKKLKEVAEEINAEYVCHLEDDFLFYNKDKKVLDDCYQFLDENLDCGYLRIVKYEFDNKDKYDKFLNHPEKDKANCQRHFNNIDNKKLKWSDPVNIGNSTFYKNNWHWYNYPNICRSSVFKKIIPNKDIGPLHDLEKFMMEKYHEFNLKVGVLDLGLTSHLDFKLNKNTSVRIMLQADKKRIDEISHKEVLQQIELTKPE